MIVWLDLETTGLDPRRCKIIELAAVVTPSLTDLTEVSSFEGIANEAYWYDDQSVWDQPALEMHQKSGLYSLLKTAPYTSPGQLVASFLKTLPSVEGGLHTLAGSSVYFDLGFLNQVQPMHRVFSHRLYDTSTLKYLADARGLKLPPDTRSHRAMDDVREAVARHSWVMENL